MLPSEAQYCPRAKYKDIGSRGSSLVPFKGKSRDTRDAAMPVPLEKAHTSFGVGKSRSLYSGVGWGGGGLCLMTFSSKVRVQSTGLRSRGTGLRLRGIYEKSWAMWELMGGNFAVCTVRSLGIVMYLPCKIVVSGPATGMSEVVSILLVSLLVWCLNWVQLRLWFRRP